MHTRAEKSIAASRDPTRAKRPNPALAPRSRAHLLRDIPPAAHPVLQTPRRTPAQRVTPSPNPGASPARAGMELPPSFRAAPSGLKFALHTVRLAATRGRTDSHSLSAVHSNRAKAAQPQTPESEQSGETIQPATPLRSAS